MNFPNHPEPQNRHERRTVAAGHYPAYATIPVWQQISGMSRTGTYNALEQSHLRAVKFGGRTLIDVEAGLAWMRSLPAAQIGAAKHAA
jgi:hypothetical protein